MAYIQDRAGGHGDTACRAGVVSGQDQGAIGEIGESAVGVDAAQGQDSSSRLREPESAGAVTDGSADRQRVTQGGDDGVRHRDRSGAQVEGISAGKGEVAVPILDIITRVDDRSRARVKGDARADAESTRAEGAIAADHQTALRKGKTPGAGVAPAESQRAGTGLSHATGKSHIATDGEGGGRATHHFPGLAGQGHHGRGDGHIATLGGDGDAVVGAGGTDGKDTAGAARGDGDAGRRRSGRSTDETQPVRGDAHIVQARRDDCAGGIGGAEDQRVGADRRSAQIGGAGGIARPIGVVGVIGIPVSVLVPSPID